MESEKKLVPSFWRIVAIAALCACAVLAILIANKPATTSAPADETVADQAADEGATEGEDTKLTLVEGEDPLSLWTEGATSKQALIDYVEAVTDESSPDFIPVEDRVATFDFDGTLFCETDPNYFDYTLLKYRVLEDPEYKDKASDFEREVASKIKEQNESGKSFSGLEVDHGKAVSTAFAGMTVDEFNAYIQEFKKQTMPSYDGMLRGEGFYKPMLQIIDYLEANDFTVYIISGTDRLIVRGIFDNSVLDRLPNVQLIGSDESLVASNQNGEDGLKYQFTAQDKLILGGDFLIKNFKMIELLWQRAHGTS